MKLKDIFYAPADWLMSAKSELGYFMRLMVLGNGTLALVWAPIFAVIHFNTSALDGAIAKIDAGPGVVFNNVAHCVETGRPAVACARSWESANAFVNAQGTAVVYREAAECAAIHGDCTASTQTVAITTMAGDVPVVMYVPVTTHRPPVLGWQALATDLEVAVPLYGAPQAGFAWRQDGRRLSMP